MRFWILIAFLFVSACTTVRRECAVVIASPVNGHAIVSSQCGLNLVPFSGDPPWIGEVVTLTMQKDHVYNVERNGCEAPTQP